jgi:hypothetical protein
VVCGEDADRSAANRQAAKEAVAGKKEFIAE